MSEREFSQQEARAMYDVLQKIGRKMWEDDRLPDYDLIESISLDVSIALIGVCRVEAGEAGE